jgi:hypothetical protein
MQWNSVEDLRKRSEVAVTHEIETRLQRVQCIDPLIASKAQGLGYQFDGFPEIPNREKLTVMYGFIDVARWELPHALVLGEALPIFILFPPRETIWHSITIRAYVDAGYGEDHHQTTCRGLLLYRDRFKGQRFK